MFPSMCSFNPTFFSCSSSQFSHCNCFTFPHHHFPFFFKYFQVELEEEWNEQGGK